MSVHLLQLQQTQNKGKSEKKGKQRLLTEKQKNVYAGKFTWSCRLPVRAQTQKKASHRKFQPECLLYMKLKGKQILLSFASQVGSANIKVCSYNQFCGNLVLLGTGVKGTAAGPAHPSAECQGSSLGSGQTTHKWPCPAPRSCSVAPFVLPSQLAAPPSPAHIMGDLSFFSWAFLTCSLCTTQV